MASRELVIDACCTVNLLATRQEVTIVRALGVHLLDTPYTSREPTAVWTPPDREGRRVREPASTSALRAHGLLVTRSLDTEALLDAFALAGQRLKTADASNVALAGVLGLPLATDDGKQRHAASELFPAIELVSTLDLLYDASRALGWDDDELAAVAADLRWRGNFGPPARDPRRAWYVALLHRAR